MQPQPPPHAPAPPPSETAILSQQKWKCIWRVGAGSVFLLLLLILFAPVFLSSHRKADLTEAVNNARQTGIALFEFETEYGRFPDPDTIEKVREMTGSDSDLGTVSSNDFFRQLIASGIAQSESIFYAHVNGTRKPDNIFTRGEALKKGECGFTYLLGAKSTDNPKRPLVVTPMIPGTDRFENRDGFYGKAVVLKMDNSVTSYPIDKDGHVLIDGRNMMDPHHPIWDGHAPVIAWPE